MSSQPFPPGGGTPTERNSAASAVGVLQTAELVADRMRAEAQAEVQRLLASARDQADRIREEARADAPKLRAEIESLRSALRRSLDQVEAARAALDALVKQHRVTSDDSPGDAARDGEAGGVR